MTNQSNAEVSAVSAALLKFAEGHVERTSDHAPPAEEQRSIGRKRFVTPALLQHLDERLLPQGDSFTAVARDISLWGLGMIFQGSPPPRGVFAVQFALGGHDYRVLAQTLWERPAVSGPFTHVGFRVLNIIKSPCLTVDGSARGGPGSENVRDERPVEGD